MPLQVSAVFQTWNDTHPLVADDLTVGTQNDFLRGVGEIGKSFNGQIFVICFGILVKDLLGLVGVNLMLIAILRISPS